LGEHEVKPSHVNFQRLCSREEACANLGDLPFLSWALSFFNLISHSCPSLLFGRVGSGWNYK